MLRFRPLAAAAALALAFIARPVLAQVASAELQAQMTPEQFKAAGLDKLSAKELSNLNAWLQGRMQAESSQAAEQARKETAQQLEKAKEEGRQEVIVKNRGFFDFGSSEPITAHLAGSFDGFAKGNRYTLDNGQVWEQSEAASLAGVHKTNPSVSIKPGIGGVWYMKIDGYNTAAKVRRIK